MTQQVKNLEVDDLEYWGESGEEIKALGHHDLGQFTDLADQKARADEPGVEDEDLPSSYGSAQHVWRKPMTKEYLRSSLRGSGFMGLPTLESLFDLTSKEGWYQPCNEGDEGAEAWTVIETGA